MIIKKGSLWYVYSKDGKKKLSKGYRTKSRALDRERQILFFKHLKK